MDARENTSGGGRDGKGAPEIAQMLKGRENKGMARRLVLWQRTKEAVMRQVHESTCTRKRTRQMVRAGAIALENLLMSDSEVAFRLGVAPMSRLKSDSNGLLGNKGDRAASTSCKDDASMMPATEDARVRVGWIRRGFRGGKR